MEKNLETIFQEIRCAYFPRWWAGQDWKIVPGNPSPESGHVNGQCKPDIRTIYIDGPSNGWEHTIIHEICHAVTNGGHGRKWRERMCAAADTAEMSGRKERAWDLRKEAEQYSRLPRFSAAIVYQQIEDWILAGDNPIPKFDAIIDAVCQAYGCAYEDIARYRGCRPAYNRAVKHRIDYDEQRRRLPQPRF